MKGRGLETSERRLTTRRAGGRAGCARRSAIRARCAHGAAAAERGTLAHFAIDRGRLGRGRRLRRRDRRASAIPPSTSRYHSRWRAFRGRRPRLAGAERAAALAGRPRRDARASLRPRGRASVLLDAGAGDALALRRCRHRRAPRRARRASRVASLDLFRARRALEPIPHARCGRRRKALRALDARALARCVPGAATTTRWSGSTAACRCCNRLGAALEPEPGHVRHAAAARRPVRLPAQSQSQTASCRPRRSWRRCSRRSAPIWPGRLALGGVNLGDVWRHPAAASGDPTDGLVPFHKLSQWLAYSLIEPLEDAGIAVTELGCADRAAPSTAMAAC